ncbi:hypothetical protein [Microbulbifer zhoushanensis]|uniref:hypothetical protein n=1 Tax=Microbulbifer zhoushanensis TaxID=2904254 RepID=UPI001F1FD8E9|nr:hypothetical protein [Microbulbifer zhoushanensis]
MIKKLIVLTLAVVATGCAGVKNMPLSADAGPMIEGRQLSGVSREKPDFIATTPGNSMFGAVGVIAMVKTGNKLVKENNIEDPAGRIYDILADAMAQEHKLVLLDDNTVTAEGNDVEELTAQVNDSRLLLDVQTLGWKFLNFPLNFSKYQVGYGVRMKLVDTSTNEILAEAQCGQASPEEVEQAPTHDELLANNASLLKQKLREAADHCANEFKVNTLML